MQALVKEGHTVYAVAPEGEVFHKFKISGIKAIPYKIDRSSINPVKELQAIYNIYKAIKPLKLDIIHTFTAKPNIYGTIAAHYAKVPTILNLVEGLGSFYIENNLKSKIMRTIIEFGYKNVFKYSQATVFVNSDDPNYLQNKHIISKEKTTIIKSVGVDTNYFDPSTVDKKVIESLKRTLNLENKFIVLMVARGIWHKGVKEYYDSALALKDKNIQYILVGGVDQGNPSCADEHYLTTGNVLWLGQRSDIKELIAMCDIFVLPSYREGVPRTLLEASSMKKAIITTDTVGCREVVIDSHNGYLIPTHSAKSITQKVLELSHNISLCNQMGQLGRKKMIEEFDTKIVVKQYLELYSRFLNV